jgi:hypothetical protein
MFCDEGAYLGDKAGLLLVHLSPVVGVQHRSVGLAEDGSIVPNADVPTE